MEIFVVALSIVLMLATVGYLVGTLIRSIQDQRRGNMKVWKNFGLSIAFCILFFASWVGQAFTEWQHYKQDQKDHNEQAELGEYFTEFSQSTFENWQSEFLQLFSFTVMSALLIHKGSAESKDSDEQMQQSLKRIEEALGTNKS